jgi:hypothetical protein
MVNTGIWRKTDILAGFFNLLPVFSHNYIDLALNSGLPEVLVYIQQGIGNEWTCGTKATGQEVQMECIHHRHPR